MNTTALMMRPDAAREVHAAVAAVHRTGQRPPRPPPRAVNLPGALAAEVTPAADPKKPRCDFRAGPLGVVQIDGPMWYTASVYSAYCPGASIGSIIHALDRFTADASLGGVVLDIQSPGGEAEPMADLADAVRRCRAAKPVFARMSSTYSLGYAAGCLAHEISMSPGGRVGSIGSLIWTLDETASLAADGLRFVAASSAARKLKHAPGQPVDDEAVAEMQAVVDRYGADFYALVAEGRGITAGSVAALEGAEFFAEDARALGLIDAVETEHAFYARVLAAVEGGVAGRIGPGRTTTTTTTTGRVAPRPAGVAARTTKGASMSGTNNKGGVAKAMTADELIEKAKNKGMDDDQVAAFSALLDDDEEATASVEEEEEATANAGNAAPAQNRAQGRAQNRRPAGGTAANFAELDEVVPQAIDGRDTLIATMLREGVSVAAAQSRVTNALVEQVNGLSKAGATAQAAAAATAPHLRGRPPVRGGNRGGTPPAAGNAVQRFDAAVAEHAKAANCKRSAAVAHVARTQPELHAAYVAEVNAPKAG